MEVLILLKMSYEDEVLSVSIVLFAFVSCLCTGNFQMGLLDVYMTAF